MWYPPTVTIAAASEPVTSAQVKTQCRIDDADSDDLITRFIAAARATVESRCGIRLITQTLAIKCDQFRDLCHLPFGPVQSITSIQYVDANGDTQTLATSVWELRADGLDAAVVLENGQSWPSIQTGSRVVVTVIVGFSTVPADLIQAILLLIAGWFENREEVVMGVAVANLPESVGVQSILANHRLGP